MSTDQCPYANTDTTPCVLKDGPVCWAVGSLGEPICVGCEKSPETLGVETPADWWGQSTRKVRVMIEEDRFHPHSFFDDVRLFNQRFDLPHHGDGEPPRLLPEDLLMFRTKHMVEELQEFRDACAAKDLEGAADALVDLIYVALGAAHFMRIPFNECWAEVQRANMTKVRANGADDSRSKRHHSFDVVKPPGFVPPDHRKILGLPT